MDKEAQINEIKKHWDDWRVGKEPEDFVEWCLEQGYSEWAILWSIKEVEDQEIVKVLKNGT